MHEHYSVEDKHVCFYSIQTPQVEKGNYSLISDAVLFGWNETPHTVPMHLVGDRWCGVTILYLFCRLSAVSCCFDKGYAEKLYPWATPCPSQPSSRPALFINPDISTLLKYIHCSKETIMWPTCLASLICIPDAQKSCFLLLRSAFSQLLLIYLTDLKCRLFRRGGQN